MLHGCQNIKIILKRLKGQKLIDTLHFLSLAVQEDLWIRKLSAQIDDLYARLCIFLALYSISCILLKGSKCRSTLEDKSNQQNRKSLIFTIQYLQLFGHTENYVHYAILLNMNKPNLTQHLMIKYGAIMWLHFVITFFSSAPF